ncbi:unnamed protein product [Lepidochelys kempii]
MAGKRIHFSGFDSDWPGELVYQFCGVEDETAHLNYQHCDARPGASGVYGKMWDPKQHKWERKVIGIFSGHKWLGSSMAVMWLFASQPPSLLRFVTGSKEIIPTVRTSELGPYPPSTPETMFAGFLPLSLPCPWGLHRRVKRVRDPLLNGDEPVLFPSKAATLPSLILLVSQEVCKSLGINWGKAPHGRITVTTFPLSSSPRQHSLKGNYNQAFPSHAAQRGQRCTSFSAFPGAGGCEEPVAMCTQRLGSLCSHVIQSMVLGQVLVPLHEQRKMHSPRFEKGWWVV